MMPGNIIWRATSGKINSDGKFIAGKSIGQVTITGNFGEICSSVFINVVEHQKLTLPRLTLLPNPAPTETVDRDDEQDDDNNDLDDNDLDDNDLDEDEKTNYCSNRYTLTMKVALCARKKRHQSRKITDKDAVIQAIKEMSEEISQLNIAALPSEMSNLEQTNENQKMSEELRDE